MIIFKLRNASVTIVMARFKLTFEAKNKHLASKKNYTQEDPKSGTTSFCLAEKGIIL